MISLEDVKDVFPLLFCVLFYFKFMLPDAVQNASLFKDQKDDSSALQYFLHPMLAFCEKKRDVSILQTLLFPLVDPLFNSTFYLPHCVIPLGNCFAYQDLRVLCIKSQMSLGDIWQCLELFLIVSTRQL